MPERSYTAKPGILMAPAEENDRFEDGEIVEAAKAIYDKIKDDLPNLMKAQINEHIKSFDDSSVVVISKVLSREFDKRLDLVIKGFNEKLDEQAKSYQDKLATQAHDYQEHLANTTISKALAREVDKKLEQMNKSHEQRLFQQAKYYEGRIDNLEKGLDDSRKTYLAHVSEMKDFYELGLDQIRSTIHNLPTPVLNIPENGIQAILTVTDKAFNIVVDQPTNIYVPENSINVKMATPQVDVNLSPNFAVNVPQNAIQIKSIVNVPPRTTTQTKSILYDSTTGRPSEIVEKTEET